MVTGKFLSSDGKTNISYQLWDGAQKPVCVLQIIHGMAEHIDRYKDLAAYLNENGIIVAGEDHIGHGNSSDPSDYGYFGEKDGWVHMVDDVEKLREILAEKYPDVPFVMMGHSMGSFLCRAWLAKYGMKAFSAGKLNGSIICGTAGSNPALGVGLALCKTIRKLRGSRHKSRLLDVMAFGPYAKGIKDPRTEFDWLSYDNAVVDAYVADPASGFNFTTAGYQDLFSLLQYIAEDQCYGAMPKNLCYLLVAGLEDPVGNYAKGVIEVKEKMEAAGCTDVSQIIYEGMRHEIHNEIEKEIVWEDLRDFCLDMAEEA